jgi:hypothetical protein
VVHQPADIRTWITAWNADSKPYARTRTVEEILESLASFPNRIPTRTTSFVRHRSTVPRRWTTETGTADQPMSQAPIKACRRVDSVNLPTPHDGQGRERMAPSLQFLPQDPNGADQPMIMCRHVPAHAHRWKSVKHLRGQVQQIRPDHISSGAAPEPARGSL